MIIILCTCYKIIPQGRRITPQFSIKTGTFCLPSFLDTNGGGPRVVVSTAAFHAGVRGSVPGLAGLKETKMFLPHPRVKLSIVGSLRDREVACSASDRQGSNFESCVWRTVSSHSSHHPQEVLLAQFSLYVHKGGLKPGIHFISRHEPITLSVPPTFQGNLIKQSIIRQSSRIITCRVAYHHHHHHHFVLKTS